MSAFPANAPPSRNPTDDDSMPGMFNIVLSKFLQGVDDMLPAQVIAYNRTTNMAQVQPLISQVTTQNTVVPRAQVMSVPVTQLGGGGFMMNFPIKPNDLGWIKANDRDISIFKQLWATCVPNTARKHNFADGTFIPVAFVNFVIANSDADNLVIQKLDASLRLSLGAGNACVSDQVGYAQSVNCVLDVQSISRAFKVPRMTLAQQASIASPIGGMIVYILDSSPDPKFSFYVDGIGWS